MTFEFPCFDPVLVHLFGPIDLRWYGLAYVAGFVLAQFVLVRLSRREFLPVSKDAAQDLLFWCVLGVLLGGRLGYAAFYDHELLDPVRIFKIWEGGMSFHGGLIGVFVAFVLYARRHGVPFRRVGDAVAIAVTPGIFLVRCATSSTA
ncbi:MAG: prolipoprotein diacylglyceryl transferase [Planctomycetota bacterium]